MSNPSTLQTISQFFVLIGIIITGISSFTSYHFGKKADELKEKVSQQEITQSQIDRQDLKNMLEPFVDFAQSKFPHINQSDALKKLADEFRNLEEKTNIISEKTNILTDKTTSLENRISYYSLKSDEIKEIANVLKSYKNIKVSLYRENNPDIVPFVNNLIELLLKVDGP